MKRNDERYFFLETKQQKPGKQDVIGKGAFGSLRASLYGKVSTKFGTKAFGSLRTFMKRGWHFPKGIRRPRVAHFFGRKPFLFDPHAYSPFTIAHLEHHHCRRAELGAWLTLLNQERGVLSANPSARCNALLPN